MYSDNETAEDLLGFDDQVEDLLAVVTDAAMLPVTVGVLGDWGSGKSSLLKMAAVRLREHGALVVEFSPWRIESYDDAKTAILGAVLEAVAASLPPEAEAPDPTRREKAVAALRRLRRRVRWMRVAGLAAKHLITLTPPSVDDLDGLLREEPDDDDADTASPPSTESMSRDFRAEFAELVAGSTGAPVVVLVDDLDRCLPEQVLDVLQAIRLFLAVPGTAFVLATDERVVRDAVRLRYPQASASETDLPSEYLEKIVQVPLRIPPVSPAEAEGYLNLLVAQAHLPAEQAARCRDAARALRRRGAVAVAMNLGIARDAVGGPLSAEAEREFALMGRIARPLANGLKGNPRQIKRYLNAFELRWRTAQRRGLDADLDRAVLAKLMVLEYAQPRRVQDLHQWQAGEDGRPRALAALEAAARPAPPADPEPPNPDGAGRGGSRVAAPRPRPATPAAADAPPGWTDSPWLVEWLRLNPPLAGVDLRPYFELGRAALPAVAIRARELPPALQDLLQRMASATSDVRERAADEAAALPAAQAVQLVEAGCDRLAAEAAPGGLAASVATVAAAHPATLAAVTAALRGVSFELLKPAAVFQLMLRLADSPARAELAGLLDLWAGQTTNTPLARAAAQARGELG